LKLFFHNKEVGYKTMKKIFFGKFATLAFVGAILLFGVNVAQAELPTGFKEL